MEMEEGQYPHLFNNTKTLTEGCLLQPFPQEAIYMHTHTEQYFPHFVGPDPEYLNLHDQDLISRREW